jgi:hypothetical protein
MKNELLPQRAQRKTIVDQTRNRHLLRTVESGDCPQLPLIEFTFMADKEKTYLGQE